MKREILEYLICPACLPEENSLRLRHFQDLDGDVEEGLLECGRCGGTYAINGGVACLAPFSSSYESPGMLSAYLWSHYADLFRDPDATGAYSEWAGQILPAGGAALDAGCAAGRFSFEMSRKFDLVIGIDLSESFVRTARRILKDRKLSFRIKEEGAIHSERNFVLPAEWDSGKMEFMVADAGALPFRSGLFSCVASLNLLDKVARPLEHLLEASRAALPRRAQLLVSDPFSWSEEACEPGRWLGGAAEGRFAGYGADNIAGLLSGEGGALSRAWEIVRRGAVWWKIRNHRNHFELIRSLFVKGER